MSQISSAAAPSSYEHKAATPARKLPNKWTWLASLSLLGLLSGILYLAGVAGGARSEYYASIAMSMSKNFSNFFFGAVDPAGTVSLDKIPGSYWMPAIFVKIFGFSTWAIEAPNGIAAILTVIILAITVKRIMGKTAGIIAGLMVAVTPIIAAVARSNQPQMGLMLALAAAAYFAVKGLESGKRSQLIYSGLFIALGFQMYMIEAWAVWPALIAAWFFTNQTWLKKVIDLAIAGLISLVASMAWIVVVYLVPASDRPYVGSTLHNNPFEMVFGYNALGRFGSSASGMGGASSASTSEAYRSFTPLFGGEAGIGRLFNSQVAGQISWLIPATLVAAVILFALKVQLKNTVFMFGWFVTFAVMLSAVAGMHQFYTATLALPMAALIAMAVAAILNSGKRWLLLLLAGPSMIWAAVLTAQYEYLTWTIWIQAAAFAALAIVVFASQIKAKAADAKVAAGKTLVTALTVGALAFSPAIWAVDAMFHSNVINPVAGPETMAMGGGMGAAMGGFGGGKPNFGGAMPGGAMPGAGKAPGGFGGNTIFQDDNSLTIKWLQEHRGNAKYLLVTFGAQTAASYITATGDYVMPVGGFDGNDNAPTLAKFKKLVAAGEIKFVLEDSGPGDKGSSADSSATQIKFWVNANCTAAPETSGLSNLMDCSARG